MAVALLNVALLIYTLISQSPLRSQQAIQACIPAAAGRLCWLCAGWKLGRIITGITVRRSAMEQNGELAETRRYQGVKLVIPDPYAVRHGILVFCP